MSRSLLATPPGATIKELLEDKGMNLNVFATRMGMTQKHISNLINGEVRLTPNVALRLEVVLGPPARFWINLEAIFREKVVKAEAETVGGK
jgi:HTH-type transcriptional regulator/antitoxin HigA